MSDHEARRRAVYDHDEDEPRPSGRRRRQVADWGVGEEIFDHMPGRRFERRPPRHGDEIPRGDADDGRRTIVIEPATRSSRPTSAAAGPPDEEFTSRDDALRAREAHEELWAGDEPFAEPDAPSAADELAARADGGRPGDGSAEVDEAGAPLRRRAPTAIVRGGVEAAGAP